MCAYRVPALPLHGFGLDKISEDQVEPDRDESKVGPCAFVGSLDAHLIRTVLRNILLGALSKLWVYVHGQPLEHYVIPGLGLRRQIIRHRALCEHTERRR